MKTQALHFLCGLGVVFVPVVRSAEPPATPHVWTSATFLDRVDGIVADGGANTYVAADGSVRLINLTDLNGDGNLDLVAPTAHTHNQVVDLSIFHGGKSLSPTAVTRLPTDAGKATAVADLNGDGFQDLVVANIGWDAWRTLDAELDSYIYWGGPNGFSAERRTGIPTQTAYGVAIADLDGDGSPDLVFANIGTVIGTDWFKKSYVYWGDHGKYDVAHRTVLVTERARDVKIADVNNDGHPDVLFADEGNWPATSGVEIYWGGATRADLGRRNSHLPGVGSSSLAVGDLNGDGWPEIVLANEFRVKAREMHGVYAILDSVAIDSYVYWGSPTGFSEAHRTALPTFKAMGVALGDLNGDGRPDIVFANNAGAGGSYIADRPIDGGGASYVYWNTAGGFRGNVRLALPTVHATACAVADVNGDGHNDLLFANENDDKSMNIDSLVYWGAADGLNQTRRTALPTHGANHVLAADLDGDGEREVVFSNLYDGIMPSIPSDGYVYWGNGRGDFSAKNRQVLPMVVSSYSAADVDADGYVDLYIPEAVVVDGMKGSIIYRGGPHGFTGDRRTVIADRNSFHGRFADFNRDGWLDLATSEWYPGSTDTGIYFGGPAGFSQSNRFPLRISGTRVLAVADLNHDGWLDLIYPTTHDSGNLVIFWNSPAGFDNERRTLLPNGAGTSLRIADLNRDGFLDLVIANLYDPLHTSEVDKHFGGSPAAGTAIYWGGPDGYAPERRQVLSTRGNEDVTVADFNNDGLLDLAMSSYSGGRGTKDPGSYVFLNTPAGFVDRPTVRLPTDAASGVMAADFNHDGYRDLRFANHVKDGDHGLAQSFIYWGSADGFSPARRSQFPAPGNHLLNAVDIGNVYDRSDRYDFISPAFDAGTGRRFERIEWDGATPFRTALEFQVRMADSREALEAAAWQGPAGAKTFFRKSGEPLANAGGRWVQYKATLISPDDANTPVLRAVRINYR